MRQVKTHRVLAGFLCPVLLLASCATSQKLTDNTHETRLAKKGSPAPERATAVPSKAWTYYETYYGEKTAERVLQNKTRSEESDDRTTLGDVAVGALKVLGYIVLVGIMLGAAAAGGFGAGFGGWK